MKNLSNYPHPAGDCYQVANWLGDLKPGDKYYNSAYLAAKAAKEMKIAGWKFVDYDFRTGEEIWAAPDATAAK